MKKILLVTLNSVNIGNRLQNYALQEYLHSMGYEVVSANALVEEQSLGEKVKLFVKDIFWQFGIERFQKVVLRNRRRHRFQKYNDTYINEGPILRFENANELDTSEYAFVVTGSDQVWHKWYDRKGELEYFYLEFAPEQKRIAYAPSFGFEVFPEEDREIHKRGLAKMTRLSCRELSGQKLIKELTGRDARLLPDPTFLLSAEQWSKMICPPKYECPDKYMLVYFLGSQTSEYIQAMEAVARKNKLTVIDIFNTDKPKYFTTTPDEFLWLVKNAAYICTDSFHACVFSIIFQKEFLVFPRRQEQMEMMFGRIETLLSQFGLMDHIYNGSSLEMNGKTNYAESFSQLERMVCEAESYLKEALSVH